MEMVVPPGNHPAVRRDSDSRGWRLDDARAGWSAPPEAGKSAKAHSRAIDSGERGWGFRAGWWWKARGAFPSATEARCSGCALRHRPPCPRRRPILGTVRAAISAVAADGSCVMRVKSRQRSRAGFNPSVGRYPRVAPRDRPGNARARVPDRQDRRRKTCDRRRQGQPSTS
jgi:hypothetical protein